MLGVVVKSTGSWYRVRLDDGTYHQSRIKGKFRIEGLKSTNPISVGDRVKLSLEGNDYLINEILQRKNYIIRKSVNLSKQVHIIASNIDQAFLIVTLVSPFTSTGFIDRFLVTAEAYQVPTIIVFNIITPANLPLFDFVALSAFSQPYRATCSILVVFSYSLFNITQKLFGTPGHKIDRIESCNTILNLL